MVDSKKQSKQSKGGSARKRTVAEQLADNKPRAISRRKAAEEALRQKFKGEEYIRQWELCYKEYEKIASDLARAVDRKVKARKKLRSKTQSTRDKGFDELDVLNTELGILDMKMDVVKGKIDLNAKRLKFCVPELRSIEITDPEGGNPMTGFIGVLREALQKNG